MLQTVGIVGCPLVRNSNRASSMKHIVKYLKIAVEYAAIFTIAAEVLKMALEKLQIQFPSWFDASESPKVEKLRFDTQVEKEVEP